MKKERLHKMGDVIERLAWEYPKNNVSAVTLRFWEQEGLLEPAARTEGGQRLYNEENISWVRFLKELSIAGVSIPKMRERVAYVKRELKELASKNKSRAEKVLYFVQTVETRRRRNALDIQLDFFYERLDGEQKKEKLYDTEALVRLTSSENARKLVEKAEKYGLIIPETIDGIKRFNRYEELILKVLAFLEFLKPGTTERCKNFSSIIKSLVKAGLKEGFGASRKHDGTTGYNATLYNLVLMNLDAMGLLHGD